MEKSIAIQTKGLTKRYKEKVAVNALNLTVYEGEMLALLGVNGAGKTTTIRMLSGLSVPTEGTAQILGYDVIANACGVQNFISIPPDFLGKFSTPVMAAYVNVLLYGVIGATFAMMTAIFDCNRIGYLIQGLLYFLVTAAVCMIVTIGFWQLHHHMTALICTLAGYGISYVIMGLALYRTLKKDVQFINEELA